VETRAPEVRFGSTSVWARSLIGKNGIPSGGSIADLTYATEDGLSLRYVAMGDSYSSGEGNPVGNPPWLNGACHRSVHAWPELLAASALHLNLVGFVACSGATTSAIVGDYDAPYNSSGDTSSVLGSGALLGPQDLAASADRAQLVTLTIGGNDLGFASILTECYLLGPEVSLGPVVLSPDCVNAGRISTAEAALPGVYLKLINAYQLIEENLPPGGRLVVVGYPLLFPDSSTAPVNCDWLDSKVQSNLYALNVEFDSTIAAAANATGANYVSVATALSGHELCTANSWVNPLKGGGSGDGHPTYPGQQAIETAVLHGLQLLGY
jgi:lysophospholipase L1-like esterase